MHKTSAARADETADASGRLEQLDRDEEGFLQDAGDWDTGLIAPLAAEAGLELTPERLEVIHYIREYFEQNHAVPEARTLLRHLQGRWGKEKASRRYLYRLFPRGYGQQACKIAGMRKPRKLMLDV
jgi:TusE/DsrC/DsvC family sulfur relay protein